MIVFQTHGDGVFGFKRRESVRAWHRLGVVLVTSTGDVPDGMAESDMRCRFWQVRQNPAPAPATGSLNPSLRSAHHITQRGGWLRQLAESIRACPKRHARPQPWSRQHHGAPHRHLRATASELARTPAAPTNQEPPRRSPCKLATGENRHTPCNGAAKNQPPAVLIEGRPLAPSHAA